MLFGVSGIFLDLSQHPSVSVSELDLFGKRQLQVDSRIAIDTSSPIYRQMSLEELIEARDALRAARALEGKVVEGKGAVE